MNKIWLSKIVFSSIIGVVNQALKITRSETGMDSHSFLSKYINVSVFGNWNLIKKAEFQIGRSNLLLFDWLKNIKSKEKDNLYYVLFVHLIR